MIRKLLCWFGFHKWDVEVVTSNVDGPKCSLVYDKLNDSFKVIMAMNFYCKHCKKHLGNRIIVAIFPAKDIDLGENK